MYKSCYSNSTFSRDVHGQAPEQCTNSTVSAAKEITCIWACGVRALQMPQSDYSGLGTELSLACSPHHVCCYLGCMNPELHPVQLSELDPSGSLSDPPPCWTYTWTLRSEWVLLTSFEHLSTGYITVLSSSMAEKTGCSRPSTQACSLEGRYWPCPCAVFAWSCLGNDVTFPPLNISVLHFLGPTVFRDSSPEMRVLQLDVGKMFFEKLDVLSKYRKLSGFIRKGVVFLFLICLFCTSVLLCSILPRYQV